MNKTIAMITAGILAVGLFGLASLTGSVWASTSTSTINAGGFGNPQLASQSAADPGQTSTGSNAFFNGGNPILGTSAAGTDAGQSGSASGLTINCSPGTNGVTTATVGTCSGTH